MTPGTRVRVTSGIFKGQTYIVGNMIGLQSPTLRNAVKELCLNRDVLEVTGEEGVSAEQELYQALQACRDALLTTIYDEWKLSQGHEQAQFIAINDSRVKRAREVLAKHAPKQGEEKSL